MDRQLGEVRVYGRGDGRYCMGVGRPSGRSKWVWIGWFGWKWILILLVGCFLGIGLVGVVWLEMDAGPLVWIGFYGPGTREQTISPTSLAMPQPISFWQFE